MQMIQLNVMKFIHAVHILTNEYGIEDDKNPFYGQYMSILSYLIAKNLLVQSSGFLPMSHLQFCKDIRDISRIDFYGIIELDTEDHVA